MPCTVRISNYVHIITLVALLLLNCVVSIDSHTSKTGKYVSGTLVKLMHVGNTKLCETHNYML